MIEGDVIAPTSPEVQARTEDFNIPVGGQWYESYESAFHHVRVSLYQRAT